MVISVIFPVGEETGYLLSKNLQCIALTLHQ